jgi:beta-N-acetylhexosaminidase
MHAPLILDIAGTALTPEDRKRLAHPLVGGLILFSRNWRDHAQLTKLCSQIKRINKNLLICVDHEGGRVQRFKSDGWTHLPPMKRLGDLWMQDPMAALRSATACGFVLASELRACGVDFSFTPVLDLDYARSEVIGDRAFARDPRVVTLLAKSLMHGLMQAGMASCGKHFPGHGYVKADSHTEVPVDTRGLEEILTHDAAPYGWLGQSLHSVMPAHVIYPQVDARPAGFSAQWLQNVLRDTLGFGGVIFSDDLSMAGARHLDGHQVSHTQAAQAALHAGCDMVLLCNQSLGKGQAVDELLQGMSEALQKGQWIPDEISEQRCRTLLPGEPALDWDDLMVDATYMQALESII